MILGDYFERLEGATDKFILAWTVPSFPHRSNISRG